MASIGLCGIEMSDGEAFRCGNAKLQSDCVVLKCIEAHGRELARYGFNRTVWY